MCKLTLMSSRMQTPLMLACGESRASSNDASSRLLLSMSGPAMYHSRWGGVARSSSGMDRSRLISCGGGVARSSESMYRSAWGGVAGTNGRLIRGLGTGGLGAGTGGVREAMVGVGGGGYCCNR